MNSEPEGVRDDTNANSGTPEGTEVPTTTSESGTDWSTEFVCDGTRYVLTVNAEQRERAQCLIKPKPVQTDLNRLQVIADHQESVRNVGWFIINRMTEVLARHDARKAEQTQEQHHEEEAHHWPLDGYKPNGLLPVEFVAEAVCDYIATMYGRASAGREFECLEPTSKKSAGDVLLATIIELITMMKIGTVSPAPDLPDPTNWGMP